MIRPPPRSTLFPYRRSSDLQPSSANWNTCESPSRRTPWFAALGIGFSLVVAMFRRALLDRKSTRLNSSHVSISYAVFCLKKKKHQLHTFVSNGPRDAAHAHA